MIHRVHVVFRVEKQLEGLRRAGRKADLAAQRAAQIISQLQDSELSPENSAALTKHGELRMKGCLKFDLGSGYRLVTLKQGADHYVLYCGTHDDCDRFIENNRDLRLTAGELRASTFSIQREEKAVAPPATGEVVRTTDESNLPEVDDRLLRQVFSGLTSQSPYLAHSHSECGIYNMQTLGPIGTTAPAEKGTAEKWIKK